MERRIGRIEPKKFKAKAKAEKAAPVKVTNPIKMDEDSWRAREDARTLAQAAAIKADPVRMRKAVPEAQKMMEEKVAEVRGLRAITRRKA